MLPLVSIIIPVYNTAKYLKNCLDSVVNQSYPNIEIIVINDCSTDCSQAIMNHYAQNYHNIKIVDSPLRLLPGGARNVGLDLSQGEYIYFLDSDDFIYPIFTRARLWAKTDKILYYYRRNLHSITISSKLFPNERILDVYSCLEYMYNTCKNIGFYEEFKDIIEKISQRIAIYPLLECCLWLRISKVDRNVVLSGLVDYIKEQYGIEDIKQVEYIMNRVIHSKRLKIKLNLLAKHLEKLPLNYPNNNLENVRRVLKKYSK